MQKRNSTILREMKSATDCAKYDFFAQKCSATKAKICAFFRKKWRKSVANGNPNLIYLYICKDHDSKGKVEGYRTGEYKISNVLCKLASPG